MAVLLDLLQLHFHNGCGCARDRSRCARPTKFQSCLCSSPEHRERADLEGYRACSLGWKSAAPLLWTQTETCCGSARPGWRASSPSTPSLESPSWFLRWRCLASPSIRNLCEATSVERLAVGQHAQARNLKASACGAGTGPLCRNRPA